MARRAVRNLVCTAGDNYDHQITCKVAGVAVDVSTWTFAAKIRSLSDNSVVTAFTVSTTQAASGIILISLTAAQTLALADSNRWDIERTVAGKKSTFMGGSFSVDTQVTY
jgi:uncharacterized 2Fe-2S/4Fe-4S cluster protein (DUF4445 family)